MLAHVCVENVIYNLLPDFIVVFLTESLQNVVLFLLFDQEEERGWMMVFKDSLVIVESRQLRPSFLFIYVVVPRVVHIVTSSSDEQTSQIKGWKLTHFLRIASILSTYRIEIDTLDYICCMDTSVIEIIIAVRVLKFKTELLKALRVYVESLVEVKFLIHVLHHKVERVLLGGSVQVKSVKVVAVNQLIKLVYLSNWLSCVVRIRIH